MNLKIKNFIQSYWVLLIIVALKLILQFVLVNPVYELHRDEFLHLDQANHLAFGFISVPPFTSLISKIIFLFGGDIFWIRFFPALFGALTIVITWLIIEAAGGKIVSKILVSCALLISVLLRLNILFQPNSFDILVWTIIFYLLIKYVNSGNNKWLWYLSVIIALGLYNKYTVAFLIMGLIAGLLLTSQRKIFSKITFWKALLLAVLLFLPNIIWQIHNHLPIIEHMKVLKANQLDNNSSAGFIRGQIMFFFGSIPLTLCALVAFIIYKPFKPFRFIGICFITVLTLFTILKAKDYYALGLYPVILAFAGVFIEKSLTGKWKLIIVPFLIILNLVVTLPVGKLVMPVLTPSEIVQNKAAFEKFGLLRWEDGKNHSLPQDFADMIGWREMAGKALTAYNMIPLWEQENTLVFCDNYGQTGALNYYNRGKTKEAYSFSTDYIYWLPHLKMIKNILLVGNKPSEKITVMFKDCKLVGVVENEFAREKNTGIYLLTGADPAFTELFYKMAEERKKNLDIF
jgi:hypothetical protein